MFCCFVVDVESGARVFGSVPCCCSSVWCFDAGGEGSYVLVPGRVFVHDEFDSKSAGKVSASFVVTGNSCFYPENRSLDQQDKVVDWNVPSFLS